MLNLTAAMKETSKMDKSTEKEFTTQKMEPDMRVFTFTATGKEMELFLMVTAQ